MTADLELPENIKCPYCGAGNCADGEFCSLCHKNLRPPVEIRAAAAAKKIITAARAPLASAATQRPAWRLWGRLALVAGLLLFYAQWHRQRNYFSLLDFVNLAFHEAGHVFLGFFPHFIMMLGGTIFQLLIPAVCLVQLMQSASNLGWQLCLFWLGENLLNISIYAGDALRQELPLAGGGVHDWTYLLTATGLIAQTGAVAKSIFFSGSLVIFWSLYLITKDALSGESLEPEHGLYS